MCSVVDKGGGAEDDIWTRARGWSRRRAVHQSTACKPGGRLSHNRVAYAMPGWALVMGPKARIS